MQKKYSGFEFLRAAIVCGALMFSIGFFIGILRGESEQSDLDSKEVVADSVNGMAIRRPKLSVTTAKNREFVVSQDSNSMPMSKEPSASLDEAKSLHKEFFDFLARNDSADYFWKLYGGIPELPLGFSLAEFAPIERLQSGSPTEPYQQAVRRIASRNSANPSGLRRYHFELIAFEETVGKFYSVVGNDLGGGSLPAIRILQLVLSGVGVKERDLSPGELVALQSLVQGYAEVRHERDREVWNSYWRAASRHGHPNTISGLVVDVDPTNGSKRLRTISIGADFVLDGMIQDLRKKRRDLRRSLEGLLEG